MDGRSWQEARTLPPPPAPSIPCHLLPGCGLPSLSPLPPASPCSGSISLSLSLPSLPPQLTQRFCLHMRFQHTPPKELFPVHNGLSVMRGCRPQCRSFGRPGSRMGFPQRLQWLHLCCEQQQRLDKGGTELTDAYSSGTHGWEEGNVGVGVCGWDNPAGRRQ